MSMWFDGLGRSSIPKTSVDSATTPAQQHVAVSGATNAAAANMQTAGAAAPSTSGLAGTAVTQALQARPMSSAAASNLSAFALSIGSNYISSVDGQIFLANFEGLMAMKDSRMVSSAKENCSLINNVFLRLISELKPSAVDNTSLRVRLGLDEAFALTARGLFAPFSLQGECHQLNLDMSKQKEAVLAVVQRHSPRWPMAAQALLTFPADINDTALNAKYQSLEILQAKFEEAEKKLLREQQYKDETKVKAQSMHADLLLLENKLENASPTHPDFHQLQFEVSELTRKLLMECRACINAAKREHAAYEEQRLCGLDMQVLMQEIIDLKVKREDFIIQSKKAANL